MTVQEIREMIDSTLNSNGKREITGQSLNAALHAILDLVIEGGSLGSSAITILLPNEPTFDLDNQTEELIENNKACYAALKNQTEPMFIFLKYLGAKKPLSQLAVRMRHLWEQGEGSDFFAFSYPVTIEGENGYVNPFVISTDMWRLDSDGVIKKIDYYGTNVHLVDLAKLEGTYNQEYVSSSNATLSNSFLPKIYCDTTSSTYKIENLFGNNLNQPVNAELSLDGNVLTVIGGWQHPGLGSVDSDIIFDVHDNTLVMRGPVTIGGWATIDSYRLTKL